MHLWGVPVEARLLGFQYVELQDLFLWPHGNVLRRSWRRLVAGSSPPPPDRDYDPVVLYRIRQALSAYRVEVIAWDCDTAFGQGGHVRNVREYVRLGLRTARQLAAGILRITLDHAAVGRNIGPIVGHLRVLTVDAEREGVRMALENHGCQADAGQILGIIQGVASPWLGVCLDFGNFQPERDEEDFEALAPHAIHVHAKSRSFDQAGEETQINYRHRLSVLRQACYNGAITIEYEGNEPPAAGIRNTQALIERYWYASEGE